MVETENKVRDFLASLTNLNSNEKGNFQRLDDGNSRYIKDLRVNFSNAFKPNKFIIQGAFTHRFVGGY